MDFSLSPISLTPISAIAEDLNTLEPIDTSQLYCPDTFCRFDLFDDTNDPQICLNIPSTIPIKQTLKAAIVAPWVRIAFVKIDMSGDEVEETVIGVGNTSEMFDDGTCPPDVDEEACLSFEGCDICCTASIRQFQYGWGSIHSGNAVKVTIVDERAGEFNAWVARLYNNPLDGTNPFDGSYRMKATWGWITQGDEGCNSSQIERRWYSSPICWFIPMTVTTTLQNGRFVFEIEAADPMQRAQENVLPLRSGTDKNKKTFVDAVTDLAKASQPRFNVNFLARHPTDGNALPVPMTFYVPNDTSTYSEQNGPVNVWAANSQSPMDVIQKWLTQVYAKGTDGKPRGIVMNFDPTFEQPTSMSDPEQPTKGQLILWADDKPTCEEAFEDSDRRLVAGYIVHGGSCSPVITFQPSFKWIFQAAGRGGGAMTTTTGETIKQTSNCASIEGTGPRVSPAIIPAFSHGVAASIEVSMNTPLHIRANQRHFNIEAEMRVQGDPSAFLCTPLIGYMRTLAIVVINPYNLHTDLNTPCVNGICCPEWQITTSVCNETLTDKGWFIKGVDHQIKEGVYVTSYKLLLLPSAGEGPGPILGFDLLPLNESE